MGHQFRESAVNNNIYQLLSIKAKMKVFGTLLIAGFLALAAAAEGEKKGRKGCLCIKMKLDTDGNGVISQDEFSVKLATINKTRNAIAAEALFLALDVTGDKAVEQIELDEFLEDPGCDKEALFQIYKDFKSLSMDISADDVVDQAEADEYIADYVAAGFQEYARQMFKLLDLTGDGTLDADDFVN